MRSSAWRAGVGALVLGIVAAALLLADPDAERTLLLRVDGREVELTTGRETTIPCAHVEGRTHVLSAALSPLQRFARGGIRFSYPVACQVSYEEEGGGMSALVRHPLGPGVRLRRFPSVLDLNDALERHASTLEATIRSGGGSRLEREQISAPVGGETVPGAQISCLLLGQPRVTEVYFLNRAGRSFSLTLDYDAGQAREAQELFETLARTFAVDE
jgi:hypothetical protein